MDTTQFVQMAGGGSTALHYHYTPGNTIINGAMDISQRGTSFSAIASNAISLDRWKYIKSVGGTMVHTITQDTDVPTSTQAGCKFNNSMKLACTTAQPTLAAGDYVFFSQLIEGYHIRHLMGRPITLSFWVKAYKTGTYCCSLRTAAFDRCYVAEYTINSSNTWEKKTITLTMHDGSSGTWNFTNGIGMYLDFTLACGMTYGSGTKDFWNTTNFIATLSQVNGVDSTSDNFWLTGVQLELGSIATPFIHRPIQQELQLCYRYYEEMSVVNAYTYFGLATGWASNQAIAFVQYQAIKRAIPTSSFSSASHFGLYSNNGGAFYSCTNMNGIGSGYSSGYYDRMSIDMAFSSGPAAGQSYIFSSQNVSAKIKLSAEL